MLHAGLVSVTFRQLSPEEIISLVSQAGLEGIEWGGDIHVPHGDLRRAAEVRRWTEEAGLVVSSYGSYYRVGHEEPAPFTVVLETALALGAPLIRVWAGKLGSAQADAAYRQRVAEESLRIAELAQEAEVAVAYEFHGGTLTDTNESALDLLQRAQHPALGSYWQPITGAPEEYRLAGLRGVLPWLKNLHVFFWRPDYGRQPLASGETIWREYLRLAAGTGREHWALLEFVRDDAPAAFLEDATTLRAWLEAL